MLHLDLDISGKEREILIKALERYVSDLNMEIADTDKMDFRENLKAERIILRKLIKEIAEAGVITNSV